VTNPVAQVVTASMYGEDAPKWRVIHLWCPGCDHLKAIPIPAEDGTLPKNGPHWTWNGSLETPDLNPSILQHQSGSMPNCHSYLRNGQWQFLSDCTHALAGQTVDMVPLPDWVVREKEEEEN